MSVGGKVIEVLTLDGKVWIKVSSDEYDVEYSYQVLGTISGKRCSELAPNIGVSCSESYLIGVGDYSGAVARRECARVVGESVAQAATWPACGCFLLREPKVLSDGLAVGDLDPRRDEWCVGCRALTDPDDLLSPDAIAVRGDD